MRHLFLCGVLALAGCANINPVTVARVMTLDPLATDPAQIAVRLEVPGGYALPPDKTRLSFAGKAETGESLGGSYALVQSGDVWRLSADGVRGVREAQAQARQMKADGVKGQIGIALDLEPCASVAAPDPSAKVSAAISTDGGQGFMPLLRATSVEDLMLAADSDVSKIERCE